MRAQSQVRASPVRARRDYGTRPYNASFTCPVSLLLRRALPNFPLMFDKRHKQYELPEQISSIDDDGLSGYVPGDIGGQECRQTGNIGSFARTSHRDLFSNFLS